jgi:hypothetical protein
MGVTQISWFIVIWSEFKKFNILFLRIWACSTS